MDDDSLMLRVRKGDSHAMRILVERYQGPLYAFFMRSLSHPDDSEDLTQQTFIRLYGASYSPRASSSFKAFLYRIAGNLLIDHRRRQGGRREVELEQADGPGTAPFAYGSGISPEDRTSAAELEEAYRSALQELPEQWRTVLDLRVSGEMTYKEIAGVTGLSVSAVESILFRARERLSGELGEFRKGGR